MTSAGKTSKPWPESQTLFTGSFVILSVWALSQDALELGLCVRLPPIFTTWRLWLYERLLLNLKKYSGFYLINILCMFVAIQKYVKHNQILLMKFELSNSHHSFIRVTPRPRLMCLYMRTDKETQDDACDHFTSDGGRQRLCVWQETSATGFLSSVDERLVSESRCQPYEATNGMFRLNTDAQTKFRN